MSILLETKKLSSRIHEFYFQLGGGCRPAITIGAQSSDWRYAFRLCTLAAAASVPAAIAVTFVVISVFLALVLKAMNGLDFMIP